MKRSEEGNFKLLYKDSNFYYYISYCIIFLTSTFLRFNLSLVNRWANDFHYRVIELLMGGYRNLTMNDCHECFHPKLYYLFCASILNLFKIRGFDNHIITAQLINSVSGLIVILIIYVLLKQQHSNSFNLFITLALLALNPRLIGINAQASNDSFTYLFCSIAIYSGYKFLSRGGYFLSSLLLLSLFAAILTKGTSWVVAIALALTFLLKGTLEKSQRIHNYFLSATIVIVSLTGVCLGGYDFKNYNKYAHMGKDKPLHFFEPVIVGRPGVISVYDSYLSFKLLDLIKTPVIIRTLTDYPLHQTSIWTQLYAQTHSIRATNYPPAWHTMDPATLNLARLLYIIALPTIIIFIFGFAFYLKNLYKVRSYEDLLIVLTTIGYILFYIKFTYDYRDLAALKLIYILPGILPYTLIFIKGLEAFGKMITNSYALYIFRIMLVTLLCLYCYDVLLLIEQLSAKAS